MVTKLEYLSQFFDRSLGGLKKYENKHTKRWANDYISSIFCSMVFNPGSLCNTYDSSCDCDSNMCNFSGRWTTGICNSEIFK